jgi:hypothetical protein
MRARSRRAVPIPRACDSQEPLESVQSLGKRPTPNAQRPTAKWLPPGWGARAPRSLAIAPRYRELFGSHAHRRGMTAENFGEGAEMGERGARAPQKLASIVGDFVLICA